LTAATIDDGADGARAINDEDLTAATIDDGADGALAINDEGLR
jgi:hypothetical protein